MKKGEELNLIPKPVPLRKHHQEQQHQYTVLDHHGWGKEGHQRNRARDRRLAANLSGGKGNQTTGWERREVNQVCLGNRNQGRIWPAGLPEGGEHAVVTEAFYVPPADLSRLKEIVDRHHLHFKNLQKLDKPSLELHLENSKYARLSKEISEKSNQLRRMRGENLQGLSIEELQQLEKSLETGLDRVLERKGELIMEEISTLQRKGSQLEEENEQFKQLVNMPVVQRHAALESENIVYEEGQSSESVTNICNSVGAPKDYDSSDTSLKLGLPFL
ncbi:hypothetical protein NE237_022964 [Protea cynaroides]|uniref:K-box domain-containing protein n=1 Tax=Protea cynaroides TaxID=273540 RepID=A0A9Q0HE65_9MAGN|nr:hypothetical protein NE237_022964 [Protea cynaroides]